MTDNAAEIRLAYMTAPDAACAQTIAEALVGERLAACVNISTMGRSVYRWAAARADEEGRDEEGENEAVESASECFMIIKTTAAALPALRSRAIALHPYDQPAFLVLAVDGALSDPGFLNWIEKSIIF